MVIIKTASRNIAYEAAKMGEAMLELQSAFLARETRDVGSPLNNECSIGMY